MADLVLIDVGDRKISVIKSVRGLTSLGLKEAKDLVEAAENGATSVIATGMPDDLATQWAQQLANDGARVQVLTYDPTIIVPPSC